LSGKKDSQRGNSGEVETVEDSPANGTTANVPELMGGPRAVFFQGRVFLPCRSARDTQHAYNVRHCFFQRPSSTSALRSWPMICFSVCCLPVGIFAHHWLRPPPDSLSRRGRVEGG